MPANAVRAILRRIDWLFTDPSTNEWSASRLGLLAMNVVAVIVSFKMLSKGMDPTTLISATLASDATVYAFNTGGRVWKEVKRAYTIKRTSAHIA